MKSLARLTALPLIALVLSAASVSSVPNRSHFGLDKSAPEAGSSVAPPSEVKLWFTEEPAEGTISIRLLEAADAGVHVMDAVPDADDPRAFVVGLHGSLPPGVYTVSWRGMGADGHVMRDTFQFTVVAQ